ncbi:putative holin-like toxin [Brevibacillus porteri]
MAITYETMSLMIQSGLFLIALLSFIMTPKKK